MKTRPRRGATKCQWKEDWFCLAGAAPELSSVIVPARAAWLDWLGGQMDTQCGCRLSTVSRGKSVQPFCLMPFVALYSGALRTGMCC